ncbi:MAG: glycosyltransferase family 4 protein, partial [Acidobacteriota bacterium]
GVVSAHAPHDTLVLAGTGEPPSPPVEDEIRRRDLARVVRLAGYVDAADLPALYSAARAVVYPSLYEGFGLPVLEAMACGTPVLASTTSCFPEVAGKSALLVDPLATEAIAEGLWSILTDEALRRRLIHDGLRRAAGFSWHTTAQRTLEIYREALGGVVRAVAKA